MTCSGACRTARARLKRKGPASEYRARTWGLKATDLWRTNPADYAPVAAEFGIVLDAAAEAGDSLAPRHIGPDQDARLGGWVEAAGPALPGYRYPGVWCQPPYSKLGGGLDRWMEVAIDEAARGLVVVLLIPPNMGSRYMQLAHRWADEIRIYATRRGFIDPDTGRVRADNRYDSCLVILSRDHILWAKARSSARARVSYLGSPESPTWVGPYGSARHLEATASALAGRGRDLRLLGHAGPEGALHADVLEARLFYAGAVAAFHDLELEGLYPEGSYLDYDPKGLRAQGAAFVRLDRGYRKDAEVLEALALEIRKRWPHEAQALDPGNGPAPLSAGV